MILKFIEQPVMVCKDEAEAIAVLHEFMSNLGKKPTVENKVPDEEVTKVCVCVCVHMRTCVHLVRPGNEANSPKKHGTI